VNREMSRRRCERSLVVIHREREVLDHRVGEQPVGDLASLIKVGRTGELDLDPLADPHRSDVRHPQAGQSVGDRLSLRVENLRLEHDVHYDAGHGALLTFWVGRSRASLPSLPCEPAAAGHRIGGGTYAAALGCAASTALTCPITLCTWVAAAPANVAGSATNASISSRVSRSRSSSASRCRRSLSAAPFSRMASATATACSLIASCASSRPTPCPTAATRTRVVVRNGR